jgi:hypothetical protein
VCDSLSDCLQGEQAGNRKPHQRGYLRGQQPGPALGLAARGPIYQTQPCTGWFPNPNTVKCCHRTSNVSTTESNSRPGTSRPVKASLPSLLPAPESSSWRQSGERTGDSSRAASTGQRPSRAGLSLHPLVWCCLAAQAAPPGRAARSTPAACARAAGKCTVGGALQMNTAGSLCGRNTRRHSFLFVAHKSRGAAQGQCPINPHPPTHLCTKLSSC